MSKDKLIQILKNELRTVIGWAEEVGDEYLVRDPDTRKEYVEDLYRARAVLQVDPDEK